MSHPVAAGHIIGCAATGAQTRSALGDGARAAFESIAELDSDALTLTSM
jgi:hypothetical protein